MLDENISGSEKIKDAVTFIKSDGVDCPVCQSPVHQEELRRSGGRMDARNLEEDLFRRYQPSEEFGEIFPLLYSVGVCPKCHYAAFWSDFSKIGKKTQSNLRTDAYANRMNAIKMLYAEVPDFTRKRSLLSGFAAYLLALETYELFGENDAPNIRQAICALRLAWIARLLQEHGYGDDCDKLKDMFYKKALFYYKRAIERDTRGQEPMSRMSPLGPDTDKDFGYEGVIYMQAWLELKYGSRHNLLEREESLSRARSNLSKIFGFGKSSREKPSVLLNTARLVFETIEQEIAALK